MFSTVRHACFASIALLLITSTGQAGQTCRDSILSSTPDDRFDVNSDGTVSDTATGLMWKRCAEGQAGTDCTGSHTNYTWQKALEHAQQTSFANYDDWRLPNINELQSIIEQRCFFPAINLTVFPNTTTYTWSASTYATYSRNAWHVDFKVGHVSPRSKKNSLAVRLVRGGQ
ncbi:MAG: DUF1566 domain-containing protein [Lamprobacter sp.]|uniref:Lcl C-terminal domain-containing protein n=1 Tax=Lamprobacter sp. TaxID=3100796 RepID=UPI002B25E61C|nr:DUF1566 domain-containing protein [Lamprobacter sp.]MEA3642941.1 DUF1566 domain-containing protein [Lamprobacter sp.]